MSINKLYKIFSTVFILSVISICFGDKVNSEITTNKNIKTSSNKVIAKQNKKVQFICADSYAYVTKRRHPSTFAWTPRGRIAIIHWITEISPDKQTEELCDRVSSLFESAYHDNSLQLITNGIVEDRSVICTAKEPGGKCEKTLFELCPDEKSLSILISLRQILNGGGSVISLPRNNGSCPNN